MLKGNSWAEAMLTMKNQARDLNYCQVGRQLVSQSVENSLK